MSRLPWMKFYPADYLLDTAHLSPAARGLWMDTICLLWRAEPRGVLTHSRAMWSTLLRCASSDLMTILDEWAAYHICDSVTGDGNDDVTIISRRIHNGEKVRESTRLRVQKHRVTLSSNVPVTTHSNTTHSVTSEPIVTGESQKQSQNQKQKQSQNPLPLGGFDAFWTIYPRKVGKGAARKSWERLHPNPDLQGMILKAVRTASGSPDWTREAGRFIPHPATWLNEERWTDEHPADWKAQFLEQTPRPRLRPVAEVLARLEAEPDQPEEPALAVPPPLPPLA